MTDTSTPLQRSGGRETPGGRGPGRRRTAAALLIVTALVAVAGIAVLAGSPRHPETVRTFAPQEQPAVEPVADLEQIRSLVEAFLDRDVPPEDRAALVVDEPNDWPSATALIRAFDDAGARTRARLQPDSIAVELVTPELAVLDVRIELDFGGETSALLRSLVAQRVDGSWRLSADTLCGSARAAAMIGSTLTCRGDATIGHASGLPDRERMISGGEGEPIDRRTAIELGYWSDQAVRSGGAIWYVDYPDMRAGGGGPVGPAELVRVDPGTGAVTARVGLSGTDALIAADDESVWALHSAVEANGAMGERILSRVDATRAAVTGEAGVGAAAYDLEAGDGGAWVLEGGLVHRFSGPSVDRVGTIDLAFLPDQSRVAATASELWVAAPEGPARVVSAADLSTRDVTTPPGRLVASGDDVWAIGLASGSTTARLLDRNGNVVREVAMRAMLDGPAWDDGAGGIWLTGWSAASAGPVGDEAGSTHPGDAPDITSEVVQRPFATHLAANGEAEGTWWVDSVESSVGWFTAAGTGLGYSDGSGLTVVAGT